MVHTYPLVKLKKKPETFLPNIMISKKYKLKHHNYYDINLLKKIYPQICLKNKNLMFTTGVINIAYYLFFSNSNVKLYKTRLHIY